MGFLIMKQIKLTKGLFALVDDEDFEYLNQWKWCATKAHNTYYAKRTVNKKSIQMHRIILGLTDPTIFTDHIDHNGLNNQKNNLRKCTHSENMRNRSKKKQSSNNHIGVYFEKDRDLYGVRILVNKKHLRIGRFKTEEEAIKARNEAVLKYHGKFANLINK